MEKTVEKFMIVTDFEIGTKTKEEEAVQKESIRIDKIIVSRWWVWEILLFETQLGWWVKEA